MKDQQFTGGDSSFTHDFGFRERDLSSLPPPPDVASLQLVIPTEGLDTEFIWKVSQLMEISFDRQDIFEMTQLEFVVMESLRQMFSNFDRSPAQFFRYIEGSNVDSTIPGLPTKIYFGHIEVLKTRWMEFVALFREYTHKLYSVVLIWANLPNYVGMNFTFHCLTRAGGGLAFFLSPMRNHYQI